LLSSEKRIGLRLFGKWGRYSFPKNSRQVKVVKMNFRKGYVETLQKMDNLLIDPKLF